MADNRRNRRNAGSYLSLGFKTARDIVSMMDQIHGTGLVGRAQEARLEAWEDDVWEVASRMGEEFQTDFVQELTRQVLRLDGEPVRITDRIIINTLAELTHRADAIIWEAQHPALELISRYRSNLLVPLGGVIYRGFRFVVRRNRGGKVTTQMTGCVLDGEMEEMLDRLEEIIEQEEACHVG